MSGSTRNSAYWAGFRDSAPFIVIVAPFGMLFGVLAAEAGLRLVETMVFSTAVFAGAAQLTALQLMGENAPVLVILASALAVNLRMAMYSASLTPYLGSAPIWQRAFAAYITVDQTYALGVAKYEKEPDMTVPERMAYFFGVATPIVPSWCTATLVGALVGAQIPDSWALDFALPIAFIAMVTPMLRTLAHVAAAVTAMVLALGFAWLPYNLGLMVGGLGGMIAGAQVEMILRRKGTWT